MEGADRGEGPRELVRMRGEFPCDDFQPKGPGLQDCGRASIQTDRPAYLRSDRGEEVSPPAPTSSTSADGEMRDIAQSNSHFQGE